jgi:hypothetical protein
MIGYWLVIIWRLLSAAILGGFTLLSASVFVQTLIELFIRPSELHWMAFLALPISGLLSYFFGLLTIRAFTGEGRRQDGELLPPPVIAGFIHTFGAMAVFSIGLGIYEGKWQLALWGFVYVFVAYGALVSRKSPRSENHDDF